MVSATADELRRAGYTALRVEDVAAPSGVHKTTIYRRWPTKAELLAATIATMMGRSEQRCDRHGHAETCARPCWPFSP